MLPRLTRHHRPGAAPAVSGPAGQLTSAPDAVLNAADLSREILARAEGPGERWFPGVGRMLATERWASMAAEIGIGPDEYGTMRYLARDPNAGRIVTGVVGQTLSSGHQRPVLLEQLQGEPLRRYEALGLGFQNDEAHVAVALDASLDRLAAVPGAAEAVSTVLAIIHVARPEGPEYDLSSSDPDVPFSIIVGVHPSPPPNGDLRLAEGVLHECMHLQLRLLEEVVPLVRGETDRAFSPWQQTSRPVRGLLHGLHVFRAIQDFHRHLLATGSLVPSEREYVARRVEVIEVEVGEIGELSASEDLRPVGKRFVQQLLRR